MSYFFGMIFLWLIYYPLLIILRFFLFPVPKLRERLAFELKNTSEAGARSFKLDNLKADLCFEFSSEGEYQQVASLIDDSLAEGKKLELVFFSPSVEKTILELQSRYPSQIRYLRYPVLNISFSSWISSQTLILVRYDLFPEFLVWSLKKPRKLKFVWVSFKKERVKGKTVSFFKKLYLLRSNVTVFSSKADGELGFKLGFEGVVYDFRMEQIKRRMDQRLEKFQRLFALYPQFRSWLEVSPREKRLMIGNAWPQDLFLLKDIPIDYTVVIVPHKLNPEIIAEMVAQLKSFGRDPGIITDSSEHVPEGRTLIINKKGILCELYHDFGKSYVGGGFGVSVHSLLEPLVAGSEQISCGPVNYRSTEFDLAQEIGNLKEVKNSQDFIDWLSEDLLSTEVHAKLETELKAYAEYKKEVLSC